MEFNKALDGLPQIVKLLLAIFVDIIWSIYRIIREVTTNNTNVLIWDIVFIIPPIAIVTWVMDIVTILGSNKPFDFASWFPAKPAEAPKAEAKAADEKKDDTAAK
jgi:hypothetical protein